MNEEKVMFLLKFLFSVYFVFVGILYEECDIIFI